MVSFKGIVLLAFIISGAFAQPTAGQAVTACLGMHVQLRPDVLLLAKATSTQILEQIGIELNWSCPAHSNTQDAKHIIAMEMVPQTPKSVSVTALAYALPFKRDGVRVVVFYDKFEPMVINQPISAAYILGHVFAHEIGHVLSGAAHHAKEGVMQANWTADEMASMRVRRMEFTDEEGRQIRENLARAETVVGTHE